MTKAKLDYIRQYRYARYKYLRLGGKHKINRKPYYGYRWITQPILHIPSWDGDNYSPLEYEIADNLDYSHATSLKS